MVKTEEIWRYEENPEKSGNIQKPEEIPEKKIIISHLSNLWRNIFKTTEICVLKKS